jgi:thiol-disulfide isomerase/thioredoxin
VSTRNTPRRPAQRGSQPTRSKAPLVIAIVLVVVAIAAIAAVLATRDGDDSPEATPGDGGAAATGSAAPGESAPPATGEDPDISLPEELVGEIRPLTVSGSALPPLGDPAADPAIGTPAPVLTGEGFDGSTLDTAPEGGPVMVVVLAHWCPHCNAEIPRLIELDAAGRFPDDLKVVALSTAVSPQRPNFPPSEWIVEKEWPWPAIADGVDFETNSFVGAEALGVNGFPFITVVGADGTVLGRWSGESEPEEFMQRLDAALARA